MALSESTLGALIKTEIEAKFGPADDATILQKFCDAIAKAVVTHIKAAAVVNVTSVSGVTPGPGSSGTGTGTVT